MLSQIKKSDIFITKVKNRCDRYDYSKVVYVNEKTKISINLKFLNLLNYLKDL